MSRPVLRAALRPVRTQVGVEQWVVVTLNGAPLTRSILDTAVTLSVAAAHPLRRTAPNVIALQHAYRRGAATGPAHRIGATGVMIPADIVVRSGGQLYGPRAVEVREGEPDAGFGIELTEFALEPAAPSRRPAAPARYRGVTVTRSKKMPTSPR